MNRKLKQVAKNISFSVSSSLISMLISSVVVLLVPKVLSVEGYGYYQLYIFYIGYAGFFQFGLIDGVYIRYGGAYYHELDYRKMHAQFVTLCLMQTAIALPVLFFANTFFDGNRAFVWTFVMLEMVLVNIQGLLLYVLQATNRIKESAISVTIGRLFFLGGALVVVLLGIERFELVVLGDLVGRIGALVYSCIACREIVFRNLRNFRFDFLETKKNVSIGFTLMMASIASLLITGIIRFGIEKAWDIETFGKVSLTISISGLMLQFINAAAIVFFPLLRRTDQKRMPTIYRISRTLFVPMMYSAMLFYYPIKLLLELWLPQYAEGLRYMALLFPICIYEGRMSMLNYTYLKTIGNIKAIFRTNLLAVAVSSVCVVISVFVLHNLTFAMISLPVAVATRCLLADWEVNKTVGGNYWKETAIELALIICFMLTSWNIQSFIATMLYFVALLGYFFIYRKSIRQAWVKIKSVMSAL